MLIIIKTYHLIITVSYILTGSCSLRSRPLVSSQWWVDFPHLRARSDLQGRPSWSNETWWFKFISKITSPLAVQLFSSRSRQHSGSGRMSERHSQGILLHKLSWPPCCGQISCRAYSLDYSVGLWMAHKLPLRFQHCHLHHQKLSILNITIQYYNMLGFTPRNNNTMYMIYQ